MASRRRPKPSGGDDGADEVAAPGQDDFLDESEQVQVVEELRRQQREHARNYRVCTHISLCVCVRPYMHVHIVDQPTDSYMFETLTHARPTHQQRLYQALAALLLLALLYCSLMAVLGPVHLEHHHIFSKSVGPLGFLLSYLAHAASALGGLAIVSVRFLDLPYQARDRAG